MSNPTNTTPQDEKISSTLGTLHKIKNTRCELISGSDISFLEGKLKTLIDASIPEESSQNKALKDVIRTILWDWFNFITDHRTDHLQKKIEWYEERKKDREKVKELENNPPK